MPGLIVASFLVALLLTYIPLPIWAQPFRPEWVLLVVVYWCTQAPRIFGVGSAWLTGLIVDVLRGALLGQHALGFALTAYICLRFHQRIRIFPLHQQAIFVGMILLPHMSISLWVYGVLGEDPESWTYWAPVITGMIVWPWIFLLIEKFRRRL